MSYRKIVQAVSVLLIASTSAFAGTIRITNADGTPQPNVLVIVKSLDTGHEIARYLSGADGKIPAVDEDQGLYRVIATCPYGACATTIREMFAADLAGEVTVPVHSRDGSEKDAAPPVGGLNIRVRSRDGKDLSSVQILVRTPAAEKEAWYETGKTGTTKAMLPSAVSTVLVLYARKVFEYKFDTRCPATDNASGMTRCVKADQTVVVDLPI